MSLAASPSENLQASFQDGQLSVWLHEGWHGDRRGDTLECTTPLDHGVVIRLFTLYRRGDARWRAEFAWTKLRVLDARVVWAVAAVIGAFVLWAVFGRLLR